MRRAVRTLVRAIAAPAQLLAVPRCPSGTLGVLVYPFDPNPYQRLLYRAIASGPAGCAAFFVRKRSHLGPIPFLLQVTLGRRRGFSLLHLHWPQFALRLGGRPLPRASLLNARASIWWTRRLGLGLVWTVHNVVPHEAETVDDAAVSRLLAHRADHVIVHSEQAIAELHAIGARPRRVSVIPHGSYIGTYDPIERTSARTSLDLPLESRIVMFFGQIRPYKGVEDLLEAWSALAPARHPDRYLLVAGKCDDPVASGRIADAVAGGRGRFDAGYTETERVGAYFGAADVAVLPLRSVTSSGSAVLALSLGRPIVAPRLGALRDLPDEVGFFYEPGELVDALQRALSATAQELTERGDAAMRYAASLSWERIAETTVGVYRQVAFNPTPPSTRPNDGA